MSWFNWCLWCGWPVFEKNRNFHKKCGFDHWLYQNLVSCEFTTSFAVRLGKRLRCNHREMITNQSEIVIAEMKKEYDNGCIRNL